MVNTIRLIVSSFESFIEKERIDLEQACSLENYFVVKIIDHKKDFYAIYRAYETDMCESFEIMATNTFKSWGTKTHFLANFC